MPSLTGPEIACEPGNHYAGRSAITPDVGQDGGLDIPTPRCRERPRKESRDQDQDLPRRRRDRDGDLSPSSDHAALQRDRLVMRGRDPHRHPRQQARQDPAVVPHGCGSGGVGRRRPLLRPAGPGPHRSPRLRPGLPLGIPPAHHRCGPARQQPATGTRHRRSHRQRHRHPRWRPAVMGAHRGPARASQQRTFRRACDRGGIPRWRHPAAGARRTPRGGAGCTVDGVPDVGRRPGRLDRRRHGVRDADQHDVRTRARRVLAHLLRLVGCFCAAPDDGAALHARGGADRSVHRPTPGSAGGSGADRSGACCSPT